MCLLVNVTPDFAALHPGHACSNSHVKLDVCQFGFADNLFECVDRPTSKMLFKLNIEWILHVDNWDGFTALIFNEASIFIILSGASFKYFSITSGCNTKEVLKINCRKRLIVMTCSPSCPRL